MNQLASSDQRGKFVRLESLVCLSCSVLLGKQSDEEVKEIGEEELVVVKCRDKMFDGNLVQRISFI